MINIGQSIREELLQQKRTVSWLANQLNCTRTAVYRIMDKNSIDTAMLVNISVALKHNFFEDLSNDLKRKTDSSSSGEYNRSIS